jgi:8-hydroxy-5-deazaflavin:NADPH oxidoreductase
MKIAVVGRGNVGGGLADRWEQAGHEVTRIGREGGDVSEVEAVLFAVPGGALAEAVENVQGLEGKMCLDATNLFDVEPPPGFASNAEFLKSKTNGPTVKAFNLNYARLYGEIEKQPIRPSQLYCGDDEAREVTEQMIRDAGYEPTAAGGLENAALLEGTLRLLGAVGGPLFYRFWKPGEL